MLVEPPGKSCWPKIATDQLSTLYMLVASYILIHVKLKKYIFIYMDVHDIYLYRYIWKLNSSDFQSQDATFSNEKRALN